MFGSFASSCASAGDAEAKRTITTKVRTNIRVPPRIEVLAPDPYPQIRTCTSLLTSLSVTWARLSVECRGPVACVEARAVLAQGCVTLRRRRFFATPDSPQSQA